MRTFKQKLNKHKIHCDQCGLIKGDCICGITKSIDASVEIWLLTHENEFERTSNTGRLLECIHQTKVFKWHRTEPPSDLIALIESNKYNVYIVFSDERPSEKARSVSYKNDKNTAFIILDGTWKEARKMLRKSPYLDELPILSLQNLEKSKYDLRRNSDLDHICTVEVGIALLKLVGDLEASNKMNDYFKLFLEKYHRGRLG